MKPEFSENSLCVFVAVPFRIDVRAGECDRSPLGSLELRSAYVSALAREVEASRDLFEDREICAVQVGVGTGATLPLGPLSRIMTTLRAFAPVARGSEVSLRMTPQTVGTPSLAELNAGAFTRHYLDAWSFDKAVLERIGAGFTLSDIDKAIAVLDRFRFTSEAVNVLYGVPGEAPHSLRRSLDYLTQNDRVTHVAVKPWELSAAQGVLEDDRRAAYEEAAALLAKRGFVQYASRSFARSSGESVYRKAVLSGVDVVGIGAGAASRIDGFSYATTADVNAYIEHAGDFEHTTTSIRELDKRDLRRIWLAGRLRLAEGFDPQAYTERFTEAPDAALIDELAASDLACLCDDGRVAPTAEGLRCPERVVAAVTKSLSR